MTKVWASMRLRDETMTMRIGPLYAMLRAS